MTQGQGDGKDGLIINYRHLTTSSEKQGLCGRNNGTFVSAVRNSSVTDHPLSGLWLFFNLVGGDLEWRATTELIRGIFRRLFVSL